MLYFCTTSYNIKSRSNSEVKKTEVCRQKRCPFDTSTALLINIEILAT